MDISVAEKANKMNRRIIRGRFLKCRRKHGVFKESSGPDRIRDLSGNRLDHAAGSDIYMAILSISRKAVRESDSNTRSDNVC